jgi:hypothetical protein
MDVTKVLADLREQRQTIEETIMALERLGASQGRRRGRPPAWMVEARKRAAAENVDPEEESAVAEPVAEKAAKKAKKSVAA